MAYVGRMPFALVQYDAGPIISQGKIWRGPKKAACVYYFILSGLYFQ